MSYFNSVNYYCYFERLEVRDLILELWVYSRYYCYWFMLMYKWGIRLFFLIPKAVWYLLKEPAWKYWNYACVIVVIYLYRLRWLLSWCGVCLMSHICELNIVGRTIVVSLLLFFYQVTAIYCLKRYACVFMDYSLVKLSLIMLLWDYC